MEFDNTTSCKKYASNGKGNAGVTLGTIGTALGGLLWLGNGGLANLGGGLFGGGAQPVVNEVDRAVKCAEEKSILEMRIAELQSARYTDSVGIDLYREIIAASNMSDAKLGAVQKELYDYVITLSKDTALNKQASDYQFAMMKQAIDYQAIIADNKLTCCCDKTNARIDCDNKIQSLTDASIISYVNSNFLPGVLKLPITSVCPLPETAD